MKKRILSMFLAISMVASMIPATVFSVEATEGASETAQAAAETAQATAETLSSGVSTITATSDEFLGGSGLANDPYLIASDAHFRALVGHTSQGLSTGNYYLLVRSITVGSSSVGTYSRPFAGIFDGGNFNISVDIDTNDSDDNYAGLFGVIGSTAIVKNLSVSGTVDMTAYSATSATILYAGGVVGYNDLGRVENCSSSVVVNVTTTTTETGPHNTHADTTNTNNKTYYTVFSAQAYAGGIVGLNGGSVINCQGGGQINAQALSRSTLDSSSNYAYAYAGGLVGNNTNFIVNSFSTATVSSSSMMMAAGDGSRDDATATTASARSNTGGLVGTNTGSIYNSYNDGGLSADNAITGITAATTASTRTYTPVAYVGGISGSGNEATNSYWLAPTTAEAGKPENLPTHSVGTNTVTNDKMVDSFDASGTIDKGTSISGGDLWYQMATWVKANDLNTTSSTPAVSLVDPKFTYSGLNSSSVSAELPVYDLSQWLSGSAPTQAPRINLFIDKKAAVGDSTVTFISDSTKNSLVESTHAVPGETVSVIIDPSRKDVDGNIYNQTIKSVNISYAYSYDEEKMATALGKIYPIPVEGDPLTMGDVFGEIGQTSYVYNSTTGNYDLSFTMPSCDVVVEVEFDVLLGHNCSCCESDDTIVWNSIETEEQLATYSGTSGYYFLQSHLDLSSTFKSFTVSGNVYLCLNGYTITGNSSTAPFDVSGGTLTICGGDVSKTGTTSSTGGSILNTVAGNSDGQGYAIKVSNNGTLILNGAPQLTRSTSGQGGGVYLADSNANPIEITKLFSSTYARVYVVKNNTDTDKKLVTYNLLVKGQDGVDVSEFAGSFTSTNSVFYRTSQDALYVATVTPVVADFEVEGVSSPTRHSLTRTYNGTGHEIEVSAVDSGALATEYYYYGTSDTNSSSATETLPVNAGTYYVWAKLESNTAQGTNYYTEDLVCVAQLVINPLVLNNDDFKIYAIEDNYDYDGTPKYPNISVVIDTTDAHDVDYETTLYYQYNASDNGTRTFTDSAKNPQYADVTYPTAGDATNKSDSILVTVQADQKTDNANIYFYGHAEYSIGAETTKLDISVDESFTYGDILSVRVKPYAEKSGATVDYQSNNYVVSLHVEEDNGDWTYLTQVTTALSDYTYLLEYNNTLGKALKIDGNRIRVTFEVVENGAENLNGTVDYFNVNMLKKEVTVSVPGTTSKVYDGSPDFNEVELSMTWSSQTNSTDDDGLVEENDLLVAMATGYASSADVSNNHTLTITDILLSGDHAGYYTVGKVNNTGTVSIIAKNLDTIPTSIKVEVLEGVGTFATPKLTYANTLGEEVEVKGTLTYTHPTYNSYDAIVAQLKTQGVNTTLAVNYTLVPESNSNYEFTGDSVSGTITFHVVDIQFSWDSSDPAISIKSNPTYGDSGIIFYDPSKFVVSLGQGTTTGAYYLTVTDSLGATMDDLSLLPVGSYEYSVSFTSYDGVYANEPVTEGSFDVAKRVLDLSWDSLSYVYDSTEKLPTAVINNVVWVDDVDVAITGGQKNIGSYTALISLTGGDRNNYELSSSTITFSITPGTVSGIVTINTKDTDNSGTLTVGDVLTADVSSVSPAGGTVFYHWYRNDVLMASETWPSYIVKSTDTDGTLLSCKVTFTGNAEGVIGSIGMEVSSIFFAGAVTISHVTGTLTATVTGANTEKYSIYWTGVNSSYSGTSYNMSTADYGNTVTVTVFATEGSGYSGSISNSISVSAIRPYTPEITVTPGDTSASVNWETVFHGGSELLSYSLAVTTSAGSHVTGSPFAIGTAITAYTVSGLTNGQTYSFQLTATNAIGSSSSNTVQAKPTSTGDTDVDGDVITTTTTNVYVDSTGATVTETITTETNLADGSVKTTTVTKTEAADGAITIDTVSQKVDNAGSVLESYTNYSLVSDDLTITASSQEDSTTSKGSLTVKTATSDNVSLPVSLVKPVVDTKDSTFTLNTPNANIIFDNAALEQIFTTANPGSNDKLEIVAELTSANLMPNNLQDRLSSAFIVDVTVKLGGVTVSDFGLGTATVTLPYSLGDYNKAVNVYYVADTGIMTRMTDATYQSSTKTVTFTTDHFSYYAVLEEGTSFLDVASTDYYFDAVLWGVENDITSGTSTYYFSPREYCTRAQAITMLWKTMGKSYVNASIPFTDVSPTDYYYEAVRWAYARGITDGVSATTFGSNSLCTRAQIVTFMWVANGRPNVEGNMYFSDVATGSWYADAVRWAVSEGITVGTGNGTTFSPDGICSRAEIITFLYNDQGI